MLPMILPVMNDPSPVLSLSIRLADRPSIISIYFGLLLMTDTNDYAKTNSAPNGNTNDSKHSNDTYTHWIQYVVLMYAIQYINVFGREGFSTWGRGIGGAGDPLDCYRGPAGTVDPPYLGPPLVYVVGQIIKNH